MVTTVVTMDTAAAIRAAASAGSRAKKPSHNVRNIERTLSLLRVVSASPRCAKQVSLERRLFGECAFHLNRNRVAHRGQIVAVGVEGHSYGGVGEGLLRDRGVEAAAEEQRS